LKYRYEPSEISSPTYDSRIEILGGGAKDVNWILSSGNA